MKRLILIGIFLFLNMTTYAQVINFPDANFKNALLTKNPSIDRNNDGEITQQEAEQVSFVDVNKSNVSNLDGIEFFLNLVILKANDNSLTSIDVSENTLLEELELNYNDLTSLDVRFNQKLKILFCWRNELTDLNVRNNINLTLLHAADNNLGDIDVSKNVKLTDLYLSGNELTDLDVSNNVDLLVLGCGYNNLTEINITNNQLIRHFTPRGNLISSLDISNQPLLSNLDCSSNELLSLDLSNNPLITILNCTDNFLTELDVSNQESLLLMNCSRNNITELDLSKNSRLRHLAMKDTHITHLDATNSDLQTLDVSSNSRLLKTYLTGLKFDLSASGEIDLNFKDCPRIEFMCIDSEFIAPVQSLFDKPGYTPFTVSSRCDEDFFKISGKVVYDNDTDGCDAGDTGFSNLKLAISGTNSSIEVFPRQSGIYDVAVYQGDYIMTPVLDQPSYFNIDPQPTSPPEVISFPENGPQVIKDFCVTPNGNHNDLEISIIPTVQARPGFNANYQITYKNKGTATQSGSVTLAYSEDVTTFVSASPGIGGEGINQIFWNFNSLQPFESRTINATFIVNRPTDIPAVNNGDILSYSATINGNSDETPDDNLALLNQTVVNSYDPNDKTCLEGETITPEQVGSYLHYMIRFENEGTANATFITVKDVIDTTTLDIASFIPLQASHNYSTTINQSNEVVFQFDDINLPFDDANNDGYVLFKIKTKDDLQLGDVIDNHAAIYFDFNPPIITEVETVTVEEEEIEVPDLTFDYYFTLSPNPTFGPLRLTVKNPGFDVQYVTIHNSKGKPILFRDFVNIPIGHPQTPVDGEFYLSGPSDPYFFNLSRLVNGTYHLTVFNNRETLSATFIVDKGRGL